MFIENRLLIAAAIIPAIILLVYIYKKDHLEKESASLLIKLVLFGIISTALASITETIGIAVLPYFIKSGSTIYNLVLYFVVVACSEEGFKYLLVKLKTWKNPEFNCQFDGVVYSVFVSLGFALWENINYVIEYGFSTAIARAVTAVPGHACFGVYMGAFYGMAKKFDICGMNKESKIFRVLSFVVPMILHGTYDYIASSVSNTGFWIFVIFVIILFIITFKLVKKLSDDDRYIVN